jgi:hypothetical protein
MIDTNQVLLYYIITGKLYHNNEKVKGGLNNAKKNRGTRLLIKYK